MGLLDWIQQRLGKTTEATPDVEPVPTPVPTQEAKKAKKAKKAQAKKAKAERPPRERPPKPPRKRKNKKKRKQQRYDPRLRKPEPAPVVRPPTAAAPRPAAPAATPPVTPEPSAPSAPAEVPAAAAPAAAAEAPAAAASAPAAAAPAAAAEAPAAAPAAASKPARPGSTRAWIVAPKMTALLAEADAMLAQAGAPRTALIAARTKLERDWRILLPVPRGEGHLKEGYGVRHAALSARIDALPDPRQLEEAKNRAVRQALIDKAEGLSAVDDVREAIQQARALQKRWRESSRVSREAHSVLNARWRAAMDAVYARRDVEQAARLQKLEGLVVQAELLAGTSDPIRAAEAMKGLQVRWKATGGVRGEAGDALWKRFRGAADQVFADRRAATEAAEQANLAARQAIIDEVQALCAGECADPEEAIRRFHQRWKRIGHVPRAQSDALWRSFNAACDQLKRADDVDPSLLGDRDETLTFSPFAVLSKPE